MRQYLEVDAACTYESAAFQQRTRFKWIRVAVLLAFAVLIAEGCEGVGSASGGGHPGDQRDAMDGGQLGDRCDTTDGCAPGLYCKFSTLDCTSVSGANGDAFGECKAIPTSCGVPVDPVCGCDHKIYADACRAAQAGFSTGQVCDPSLTPPGRFICGGDFCDPQTSYCLRGDFDNGSSMFACKTFPAACTAGGAIPDCACLVSVVSATGCNLASDGGATGIVIHEDI